MIKSLIRLLKRYNILSEVLVLDIAEVGKGRACCTWFSL